jgi:hypothetical protein
VVLATAAELYPENHCTRHNLFEMGMSMNGKLILWKVALNTLTIYITDKTFTGFDNEYHSGECLIQQLNYIQKITAQDTISLKWV